MIDSNRIKSDVLGVGTNRYGRIRQYAREFLFKGKNRSEIRCESCGYDKHVEVCHIKPIKDFPMDTLLTEINARDNLRALCPNCHWERDNLGKENTRFCSCGARKLRRSLICRACSDEKMKAVGIKYRRTKWPSKEQLEREVNEFPFIELSKKYGVSDVAIKKWCKSYGIEVGNRLGYWQKRRNKKSS